MKRHELYHLSRDEITYLAEQYIHIMTYRNIFIDRFCDGITFDDLASKYHMDTKHIQKLMKECMLDVLTGYERGQQKS